MDGQQLKGEMDDELVKYLLKRRDELSKRPTDDAGFATEYGPMLGGVFQGAAQLGTLGGKSASAKPFTDAISGMQAREANQNAMDAAKRKELWGVDEKIATYLQEKRKRAEDLAYKDKELSLREGETTRKNQMAAQELDLKRKQAQDLADYRAKSIAQATQKATPEAKAQKEVEYRTNMLTSNAEKLKALIRQHGTGDIMGAAGDAMDSLLYQMAVDYAKLVDPTSVAREGEVAAAQKYMLPVRNMGGYAMSNDRALQVIDNYLNDVARRSEYLKSNPGAAVAAPMEAFDGRDGEAMASPPALLTDDEQQELDALRAKYRK